MLRCWQRHLSAHSLTLALIESTKGEQKMASRLRVVFYPIRNCIRTYRRWALGEEKDKDSKLYKAYTFVSSGAIPLIEILIFNFEQVKNVLYVYFISTVLKDIEEIRPTQHDFDYFLMVIMAFGVLMSQILIRIYASVYAEDIYKFHSFQEGQPLCTPKRIFYRTVAFVISPLVPTYTMINYVIYSAKLHRARRHLQTLRDDNKIGARIDLYRRILFLQNKTLKYRKIYSYFRVTSALLDSASCLIVLVLLFLVGNDAHRVPLYSAMGNRFNSFYNGLEFSESEDIVSVFHLVTGFQHADYWILVSIVWTLAIILTALVRYWFYAKDQTLTLQGQICLCFYFLSLTFNRLTTLISLLFNIQPSDGSEPIISLEVAGFLLIVLVVIRPLGVTMTKFMVSEKFRFSRPWKACKLVDRLINVMVNCLVVTPYTAQTDNIIHQPEEIQKTNSKWEFVVLFLFVLWENILSLVIEVVNGGQRTSEGLYYSWDIRLYSLLLALFFITCYYRRYHTTAQLQCPGLRFITCPLYPSTCQSKTQEDPETDEDQNKIAERTPIIGVKDSYHRSEGCFKPIKKDPKTQKSFTM